MNHAQKVPMIALLTCCTVELGCGSAHTSVTAPNHISDPRKSGQAVRSSHFVTRATASEAAGRAATGTVEGGMPSL